MSQQKQNYGRNISLCNLEEEEFVAYGISVVWAGSRGVFDLDGFIANMLLYVPKMLFVAIFWPMSSFCTFHDWICCLSHMLWFVNLQTWMGVAWSCIVAICLLAVHLSLPFSCGIFVLFQRYNFVLYSMILPLSYIHYFYYLFILKYFFDSWLPLVKSKEVLNCGMLKVPINIWKIKSFVKQVTKSVKKDKKIQNPGMKIQKYLKTSILCFHNYK